MIQKIVIKNKSQIILRINQTRATVFFDCGSSKVGVKCSSLIRINKIIKQKEYKYSKIKINIKQPYARLFLILVRLFTHKVHHNEDCNDSCECECQD